jgi:hypothetical protein
MTEYAIGSYGARLVQIALCYKADESADESKKVSLSKTFKK